MNVLIVTDIRLTFEDNHVMLQEQFFHIFERYYKYFGKVTVYCGCEKCETNARMIDGSNLINKCLIYHNLLSVVFGKDKKMLSKAIKESDLIIGRFHSFSAVVAASLCRKYKKTFMAEVMGDAWDGYWNHGLIGKLVAPWIFLKTKKAVKYADYALYVTEHFLQSRYPCNGKSIHASNVKLQNVSNDVLTERLKKIDAFDKKNISIMTSANVDVRAKGHKYVIQSISTLRKKGINVTYYIAGGGDNAFLKNVAKKNKVLDSVIFLGRLSADDVIKQIDSVDFYIQPSLQEGVPRAVIEAMSRGCVCLGARTGGIPELIKPEFIFNRKSSKSIASVLCTALNTDLKAISIHYFEKSKEFLSNTLDKRRDVFFETIISETSNL